MKTVDSSISVPKVFLSAYEQGLLVGVILFGSHLYSKDSNDIDLAVITKKDLFYKFIDSLKEEDIPPLYDVSLIKEEEIDKDKDFYFGGHGIYLVESLKKGKILLGYNPFNDYPDIALSKIKLSIFERMKEYIYVLRKSYFNKEAEEKFLCRYEKMIKLLTFLLSDRLIFPDVLELSLRECEETLKKKGFSFTENKRENIEELWRLVNQQYS